MKLVLASKSPRRREILSMVTNNFTVRVSEADETHNGIDPFLVPEHLAKIKADATPIYEDEIIIGADTIVIYKGEVLGKPKNKDEAVKMLESLSGTVHYVVSGVCIKSKKKSVSFSVTTSVKMRELENCEIYAYVEKFNPVDKAGAYGIQEMAGAFVEEINGDFYNVVGLPLCKLISTLKKEFNVDLIGDIYLD